MSTALNNLSQHDASNIPDGSPFKISIVVSEWNSMISSSLTKGAIDTLIDAGVYQNNIKVNAMKVVFLK